MPKTTAKDLLPRDILNLFQYINGHEVAELHWKKMLDTFTNSRKGKFANCISTFNISSWAHGFCCGFTLITSEFCASRSCGSRVGLGTIVLEFWT